MPERPDLEYIVDVLSRELVGRHVVAAELRKPVVLRLLLEGELETSIVGQRFVDLRRQSHFLRFGLVDQTTRRRKATRELIVSPMLAGRFDLVAQGSRLRADVAVALALDDGRQLLYRDDKQMGKVYLLAADDAAMQAAVPGLAKVGLDVLDAATFTREAFFALARKRRDQVRVFLMDKGAIDALGNAYADEVLFAAGIHPKAWMYKLDEDALGRLHAALVNVLGEAVATIRARKPPLPDKVRDFLKVRNKAGQPCPRCGVKLRRAGVRGYDAHFCPRCQPDPRGSSIVDWSKLG